jgi:uncharacterized membrane protein YfcA
MDLIAAAALLIGLLLGLLGGGGSILMVPMLTSLARQEPKTAIAISLLVVGASSAAALLPHALRKHVCWRAGGVFGGAAMLGAYLGGRAAAWIPAATLMWLFAVMMFATAFALLRKAPQAEADKLPCPAAYSKLLWFLLEGVGVGALTGLAGAGGGFLIVPALVKFGGLPMHGAVGTSLLVIAMNSFAGLLGYLNHVQVNLNLATRVSVLTMGGSLVGGWLAPRIPARALRRAFAGLVLLVALHLIYQQVKTWESVAKPDAEAAQS